MAKPTLGARVDSDTCIVCRKKFGAGHRVALVHIVEKLGRNSSNSAGAYIMEDFEVKHVDCLDPHLNGVLISR